MVLSQRDLEAALEKQSEILTASFEKIQSNLLNEISLLKHDIITTRKDASDARELAEVNAGEIARLSSTIKALVDQNKLQFEEVSKLTELVEDRTNRQLRNTLVFKNVPKEENEKSWNNTRDVLTKSVAKALKVKPAEMYSCFERVHRGRDRENGPPLIFAKLFNWNDCEKMKSAFRKLNIKKQSSIHCEQKFGPRTSYRRNQALVCRRELLNEGKIEQGFVKFPAILMVKLAGGTAFTEFRNFSTDEPVFVNSGN